MGSKPRLTESVMTGLLEMREVFERVGRKGLVKLCNVHERRRGQIGAAWVTAMWEWRLEKGKTSGPGSSSRRS